MNNYAMVPINSKFDEHGNMIVRRALISYKGKPEVRDFGTKYFKNTKLIALDPYFLDKNSSHRYIFEDDGYILIDCSYYNIRDSYKENDLLNRKREYHLPHLSDCVWLNGKSGEKILFKAANDDEAIKIFNDRKELR